KALGLPGAYVVGSALLKELLVNRCRHFLFTTALPPVVAGWWLCGVNQVQHADDRRDVLHRAAGVFRDAPAPRGLKPPGEYFIVPLLLGDEACAVAAADALQARGWDIRAIRPPTVPPGTSRLRISIHADHEPAVLRDLAAALPDIVSGAA